MKRADSLLITNGKVLLPNGELAEADILVEDGRFSRIRRKLRGAQTLDADGGYVLPGFIDIHTHGIGHESASGRLGAYAERELSQGCTALLPTLFGPPEDIAAHLKRHLEETDGLRTLPQVVGFRLESPYLARTGAGISKDLALPSSALTEELLDAGKGSIRVWDVSPELPLAAETVQALTRRGVVCSMAHTDCTIEQAKAAVDAGLRLVTHLFCTFVVPPMRDPGVWPVSLIDFCLTEDRLAVEIIPDGTHVHPILVDKAFRCKPADKLLFVTDSNYGAGLPPGDYDLPQGWGRARISGPNDGVRLIDRQMGLAGSALTPIHCFRNAVKLFGKDIAAASHVCSRNPAILLGLNKGEIAVGRDADVVVLDAEWRLRLTIVRGKVMYQAEG